MKDLYMYLSINDGITYIKKNKVKKIESQGAKVVKCEWQLKDNGFIVLKNTIDGLKYYTNKERAILKNM